MKQIRTTVTQRGQVTIPAEVRRLLGIKPRDKVAFTIEDGRVGLVPAALSLEAVFGSVQPATRTEDLEAKIQEAREEKAEREREKWRRP